EHLLSPVSRSSSGYRLYDDEAAARVQFIQRAQSLGLSLTEIRELLRAADADDPVPTAERLRHLVAHKLSATRSQITGLEQFAHQLETVYLRLGQGADGCSCRHLGACDCVPLSTDPLEVNRLQDELRAVEVRACTCGCDMPV
ncbi:MAG TPA: MerR family DNA-binding protein, partial [Candidatus Sulfotelmatobacter sp.]|nr:MerR family DNA-binding protein [Candidatus Sulfotelmatobacter sp.]